MGARKTPCNAGFSGDSHFINKELEDLQQGLSAAFDVIQPGGRVAVISFHSLEDRLVKRFLKKALKARTSPRGCRFAPTKLTALWSW